MQPATTRGLALRFAHSWQQRAVRAIVARLPPRVRQRALHALTPLSRRWPLLASLVEGTFGIAPRTRTAIDAPPHDIVEVDAERPSASPRGERQNASRADAGESRAARLIAVLSGHPDFLERGRAARSLGSTPVPDATSALIVALRDPSAEVAVEAALALGYHRRSRETAVSSLREVVEGWDSYFNPTVRAAAVRSLGMLLLPGEAGVVESAVASVDSEVSLAAISALVERREEGGAKKLLEVLEDRSGFYLPLTRKAAARALAALGFKDPLRVSALAASEDDREVRAALALLPGGTLLSS